jgi:hypothetical protein
MAAMSTSMHTFCQHFNPLYRVLNSRSIRNAHVGKKQGDLASGDLATKFTAALSNKHVQLF